MKPCKHGKYRSFAGIFFQALLFIAAGQVFSQPAPKATVELSDTLKNAHGQRDTSALLGKTLRDTLKKVPGQNRPSTLPADSASVLAATAIDTNYCFWHYGHFGIGAGWSLGSFPLFDEWIKGLPDSARKIIGTSSEVPTFSVKEPADAYNILWPINIWWAAIANERHSLCIEGSFFWITKSYEAYLQNDSNTTQWIHWQQSLSAYSFSLGLTYKFTIPDEFFHVESSNKTGFLLGFNAIPLVLIDKSASFSSSGIADSTLANAHTTIDNRSLRGLGCSWKIGLSSLHRLSTAKGLEISLLYIGRWYGYFKDHSTPAVWREINPLSSASGQNISFISSTFEISFALVSGKKPRH
jgi:hypothetical protein